MRKAKGRERARPYVIGIGGGTASGKTTLAEQLIAAVRPVETCLIDVDSYYFDHAHLSDAEKQAFNYDHPAAIDHSLLAQHLKQLLRGESIAKPCYSFSTHCRLAQTQPKTAAPVAIVEGLFALVDERLRRFMDLKIYVDAEPDVRFIRRLRRDISERGRSVESVIGQYLETVRPMHLEFVEPTRRFADVVFKTGDSVEDLVRRIRGEGE